MGTHEGRVALVTGAARGIGQAIAAGMARRGARVVALDILDGGETVERIRAGGGEAMAVTADLADARAVKEAVGAARARFDSIDIVVNNAAVSNSIGFSTVTPEEWRRVMSINLDGPFLVLHETVPDMVAKGWGRIVNVASSSIYTTAPDKVPYMASKAGVLGLTLGLANELGASGITVNAVSPGLTPTEVLSAQIRDGRISREFVESMWTRQAIPREPTVADLIGPVLFLTGEDSAMVTGQFLTADGGISHHL